MFSFKIVKLKCNQIRKYHYAACNIENLVKNIFSVPIVIDDNTKQNELQKLHGNSVVIKNIKDEKYKIPTFITSNLLITNCSIGFLNKSINKSKFPYVENIFILGHIDNNFLNYWIKYKNVDLYLPNQIITDPSHSGNCITYDEKIYNLIKSLT